MKKKDWKTLHKNKDIIDLLKELDSIVVSPVFDKISNHILDKTELSRSRNDIFLMKRRTKVLKLKGYLIDIKVDDTKLCVVDSRGV